MAMLQTGIHTSLDTFFSQELLPSHSYTSMTQIEEEKVYVFLHNFLEISTSGIIDNSEDRPGLTANYQQLKLCFQYIIGQGKKLWEIQNKKNAQLSAKNDVQKTQISNLKGQIERKDREALEESKKKEEDSKKIESLENVVKDLERHIFCVDDQLKLRFRKEEKPRQMKIDDPESVFQRQISAIKDRLKKYIRQEKNQTVTVRSLANWMFPISQSAKPQGRVSTTGKKIVQVELDKLFECWKDMSYFCNFNSRRGEFCKRNMQNTSMKEIYQKRIQFLFELVDIQVQKLQHQNQLLEDERDKLYKENKDLRQLMSQISPNNSTIQFDISVQSSQPTSSYQDKYSERLRP